MIVGVVAALFLFVGVAGGTAVWFLSRPTPAEKQPVVSQNQAESPTKDRDKSVDPPITKVDPPKDKQTRPPSSDSDEVDLSHLLATINARRKGAGVAEVTISDEFSIGCRDHARYLTRNLDAHPTLDPHDEVALPDATPAGKAAAAYCTVSPISPKEAIDAWLGAPAHRLLLLDAELTSIGLGHVRKGDGWITVLDAIRGTPVKPDPAGAIVYPAPRQIGVPLAFPGNEVPDPLPEAKVKLAGFPVTVTFPARAKVVGGKARLEDEAGRSLPVWFSSPEKPANEKHARLQQNTLCLFAHEPLSPGTRYVVSFEAEVNGKPWSRAWSFTTVGAEQTTPRMYRRALARFNELRKNAGLPAVTIDETRAKGCVAHARYLARHLGHTPDVRPNEQKPGLVGASEEGRAVARLALVRLGGGTGPADAVDWMLDSVLNRHLVLNPSQKTVAFGAGQHFPRGWIWVVSVESQLIRTRGEPAVLYPGRDMKDAPRYFGRSINEAVADQPKGHAAGFAITANFFLGAKVVGATGELLDPDGNPVDTWLSTPEKPLPGTGGYKQILLIPKKPLAAKTTYSVKMSCEADGQPWAREWRFTTVDADAQEASTAERLRDAVNEARRWAGLGEVTLDEKLSRGCSLHAKYVARNLEHPKVQGLSIHDEDASLPGATPAGAKAGKASVIAVLPEPIDSVDGWIATLYHRIPLLDPALKRIGYGQEQHPTKGWVTVLDAVNGR